MTTPNYPEHDKLTLCKDQSQIIGEFLDWLTYEKSIHLAKWNRYNEMVPDHTNTQELLAEFFEIDLNVLEQEKRTMLDELRKANESG